MASQVTQSRQDGVYHGQPSHTEQTRWSLPWPAKSHRADKIESTMASQVNTEQTRWSLLYGQTHSYSWTVSLCTPRPSCRQTVETMSLVSWTLYSLQQERCPPCSPTAQEGHTWTRHFNTVAARHFGRSSSRPLDSLSVCMCEQVRGESDVGMPFRLGFLSIRFHLRL